MSLHFKKGLIHGIAACADCKWKSEDYLTVQRQARIHHHKTGHAINIELGYHAEYKRRSGTL